MIRNLAQENNEIIKNLRNNNKLNQLASLYSSISLKLPEINSLATQYYNNYKFYDDLSKKIHNTYKENFAQINQMTKTISDVAIRVSKVLNSLEFQNMYKQLNTIALNSSKIENIFRALNQSKIASSNLFSTDIQSKILEMNSKFRSLNLNIGNIDYEQLNDIIKKINYQNIVFNQPGKVKYKSDEKTREEIQEFVENTISEISEQNINVSLEITINKLINNCSSQKSPILKTILFNLISAILFMFLSPHLQNFTNNHFINPKPIVKIIKKESNSLEISKDQLKDIKFVTTTILNVRSSNSIKSKVVGKLYIGQIVSVLHQKRSWTLIEFKQDNIIIKGWVFSRYLFRLKK